MNRSVTNNKLTKRFVSFSLLFAAAFSAQAEQPPFHIDYIGLNGDEYQQGTPANPRWDTRYIQVNDNGQIAGNVEEISSVHPGYIDEAAWVYDGYNTHEVGLTDALHLDPTYLVPTNRVQHINENGDVAGSSVQRGSTLGNSSAWLYKDGETVKVGLKVVAITSGIALATRSDHCCLP